MGIFGLVLGTVCAVTLAARSAAAAWGAEGREAGRRSHGAANHSEGRQGGRIEQGRGIARGGPIGNGGQIDSGHRIERGSRLDGGGRRIDRNPPATDLAAARFRDDRRPHGGHVQNLQPGHTVSRGQHVHTSQCGHGYGGGHHHGHHDNHGDHHDGWSFSFGFNSFYPRYQYYYPYYPYYPYAYAPSSFVITSPFYCFPCGTGFLGLTLFHYHVHSVHGIAIGAIDPWLYDVGGRVVFYGH